ncbi:MAG: YggS family pyridoxal phosphate-dependent enzyme [Candidatus Margulisbacteria bacterium]|nr:YggS family pyridoxal phosphate-dependent enzyme [Candidatus Margulisiibacteriota bacterium]
MSIKENLKIIRAKIAKAARSVGRQPEEITIIAVTKTISVELIEQAIQAGITDIGENRIQEAIPKIQALRAKYPQVTWHMVGHLQSNKVKQTLENFDIIQSVDSLKLADRIGNRGIGESGMGHQDIRKSGTKRIMVEVNTSGEASKFGIKPEETIKLLQNIAAFGNLRVEGLMTVGPLAEKAEDSRTAFKRLKQLSEQIKQLNLPNVEMKYLSMGMSDDFEIAIEEGSNMVRLGRALFGARPPKIY